MRVRPWRIAIGGFALESNRFAPITAASDFSEGLQLQGNALGEWLRQSNEDAFCDELDRLLGAEAWSAVPLALAVAGPGGPCDEGFFADHMAQLDRVLDQAFSQGSVDAVYVISHGAATTTVDDDPDGRLLARVRARLGQDRPLVVLNDFHANVSDRALEAASVLVGYRRNPHTDVLERSREAARLMARLLRGWRPVRHWIRVPMLVPQVMQLTAPPAPMAPLFEALERTLAQPGLVSASIWPGFSLADVPHAGLVVHVAGDDATLVREAARALALQAWGLRAHLRPRLCSLDCALEAARQQATRPLILADVADNPGGGGRGLTRWLLHALWHADIPGVVAGLFWAPDAVLQAQAAGVGGEFDLRLDAEGEAAGPVVQARAKVLALHDGRISSRVGMCAGQTLRLGATAILAFDGIRLVCNSIRQQILGCDVLEDLGLAPAQARVLLLKSRGHFRAGFSHLVPDDRILELDAPGLTSPAFERFAFKRLPQGLYPFAPDRVWDAGA